MQHRSLTALPLPPQSHPQVHTPYHYTAPPKHARLFESDALERLSKTSWPAVLGWLPVAAALWAPYARAAHASAAGALLLAAAGLVCWSAVEYGLHRWLFHCDASLPDHVAFRQLHFCIHGIHHRCPMDRLRLVLPPALLALLAVPVYAVFRLALPIESGVISHESWHALFGAGLVGYVCYDLLHYAQVSAAVRAPTSAPTPPRTATPRAWCSHSHGARVALAFALALALAVTLAVAGPTTTAATPRPRAPPAATARTPPQLTPGPPLPPPPPPPPPAPLPRRARLVLRAAKTTPPGAPLRHSRRCGRRHGGVRRHHTAVGPRLWHAAGGGGGVKGDVAQERRRAWPAAATGTAVALGDHRATAGGTASVTLTVTRMVSDSPETNRPQNGGVVAAAAAGAPPARCRGGGARPAARDGGEPTSCCSVGAGRRATGGCALQRHGGFGLTRRRSARGASQRQPRAGRPRRRAPRRDF